MKTEILYTEHLDAAKQEIVQVQGKISQEFTEHLFSVQLPESFDTKELRFSTIDVPENIEEKSRLAYNAWQSYKDKKSQKDLAPDHREGLSWDTEGFESPKCMTPLIFPDTESGGVHLSSNTPTSRHMTETVAVGLVIVSGGGNFKFTNTEEQLVVSEVQEALQFLSSEEPRAKLSFIYDIHSIDIAAAPGSTANYESAEGPWRNEALSKMGFSASRQGSIDYVNSLRSSKGTKWAYVAYFTKYELKHFAYAIDEKLVMNFFNDGWGTKFLNRVFAHETCHIFGAADEYGSCSCDSVHGHLSISNGNCRRCAPGGGVVCLMDSNELTLCDWSRKQIGWDVSLFPV